MLELNQVKLHHSFIVVLCKSFDNWIKCSKIEQTFEGLRKFFILDQFMSACPPVLRTHLKELGAKTLEKVVTTTDDWLWVHRGALKDPLGKLNKSAKLPIPQNDNKSTFTKRPSGLPREDNYTNLGNFNFSKTETMFYMR